MTSRREVRESLSQGVRAFRDVLQALSNPLPTTLDALLEVEDLFGLAQNLPLVQFSPFVMLPENLSTDAPERTGHGTEGHRAALDGPAPSGRQASRPEVAAAPHQTGPSGPPAPAKPSSGVPSNLLANATAPSPRGVAATQGSSKAYGTYDAQTPRFEPSAPSMGTGAATQPGPSAARQSSETLLGRLADDILSATERHDQGSAATSPGEASSPGGTWSPAVPRLERHPTQMAQLVNRMQQAPARPIEASGVPSQAAAAATTPPPHRGTAPSRQPAALASDLSRARRMAFDNVTLALLDRLAQEVLSRPAPQGRSSPVEPPRPEAQQAQEGLGAAPGRVGSRPGVLDSVPHPHSQMPTHAALNHVSLADGRVFDAEALAALINEVLVEQARLYGVDLS